MLINEMEALGIFKNDPTAREKIVNMVSEDNDKVTNVIYKAKDDYEKEQEETLKEYRKRLGELSMMVTLKKK